MRVVLEAPAKVNMCLDVVGRRADGYHLLRTVAHSIDCSDKLMLEDAGPAPRAEVELRCNWPSIPTDGRNSVCKAVEALADAVGLHRRINAVLEKCIPVASGLGGESTDAAATLRGLNELLGLGLTVSQLRSIAARVGADVPFCVTGGTALVEGIGDEVSPLTWGGCDIGYLLVLPPGALSTAQVYREFAGIPIGGGYPRADVDGLVDWLANYAGPADIGAACPEYFMNALEVVTAAHIPEVLAVKRKLLELGAMASFMTGHGPTVVGLFERSRLEELSDIGGLFPGMWAVKARPALGPARRATSCELDADSV